MVAVPAKGSWVGWGDLRGERGGQQTAAQQASSAGRGPEHLPTSRREAPLAHRIRATARTRPHGATTSSCTLCGRQRRGWRQFLAALSCGLPGCRAAGLRRSGSGAAPHPPPPPRAGPARRPSTDLHHEAGVGVEDGREGSSQAEGRQHAPPLAHVLVAARRNHDGAQLAGDHGGEHLLRGGREAGARVAKRRGGAGAGQLHSGARRSGARAWVEGGRCSGVRRSSGEGSRTSRKLYSCPYTRQPAAAIMTRKLRAASRSCDASCRCLHHKQAGWSPCVNGGAGMCRPGAGRGRGRRKRPASALAAACRTRSKAPRLAAAAVPPERRLAQGPGARAALQGAGGPAPRALPGSLGRQAPCSGLGCVARCRKGGQRSLCAAWSAPAAFSPDWRRMAAPGGRLQLRGLGIVSHPCAGIAVSRSP